jgi:hypothetical protein
VAEALLAIGVLVVVLGLPLFGIGWLIARWLHRRSPDTRKIRVTTPGLLFYGSMVLCWVAGLIWAAGHPDSSLRKLLDTGGIAVYVFAMGIPFVFGTALEEREK